MLYLINKDKYGVQFENTEKKYFESQNERDLFVINQMKKGYFPKDQIELTSEWETILNLAFGARNWFEGIEDNSYNTTSNGWYNSYSGYKFYEDCGIYIKGSRATGDAYYASNGKVTFEFKETSKIGLKIAQKNRVNELNNLIKKYKKEIKRLKIGV